MRIYNKLVRDNIPEIIAEKGEHAEIKILDEKQYNKQLRRKLREEVFEYLQSEEVEELADIAEVIEALAELKGCSFEKLMEIKEQKAQKNGRFEKRILLKSVKE